MTKPEDLMKENEASDEPTPVPSMRVARVWKRYRNGRTEGSLGTSLKAMAVLYDAGEPLTREELEARLIERLDPYARGYLMAWYQRHRALQRGAHRRKQSIERMAVRSIDDDPSYDDAPVPIERAVHNWITSVFMQRLARNSLRRTTDGKLVPGPRPPRIARLDGSVMPYTPETRKQFEQEDHEAHRQYLALMEWSDLMKTLPVSSQTARAQLLMLVIRRLFIGLKGDRPLDERLVSPKLTRLIELADSPAVQKAVLERAFAALWTTP